ncbi:MAG: hypothetical protein FJZ63_01880 [Chlamydiae bacterium]|nr:hypothetical protein [Chlamydiota bacterium]
MSSPTRRTERPDSPFPFHTLNITPPEVAPLTLSDPISKAWPMLTSTEDAAPLDRSEEEVDYFNIANEPFYKDIKTVNLSDNPDLTLDSPTLPQWLETSLSSLYLAHTGHGAQSLLDALCLRGEQKQPCPLSTHLKCLDIAQYPASHSLPHFVKMFTCLPKYLPHLERLSLRQCSFVDTPLLDSLLKSESTQSLRYLDISNCKLTTLSLPKNWFLSLGDTSPKKTARRTSSSSSGFEDSFSLQRCLQKIGHHELFMPPIHEEKPFFILDARQNPLNHCTQQLLNEHFNSIPSLDGEHSFHLFYNRDQQVYILTNSFEPAPARAVKV